ncbi:4a-hydroxytetrahydrobiopterin dehydratase [Natrinema hispanicum]|uniref:4a-hydroxytetrahydrobiopterin dehydratase n=1 Tax=Natrinema hispanicum TaxID=392421 RepID=A0A482YHV5_9EURY|nr:4a-hydroxytetrahydrobiopterin dehydratase [Natrinema hispanicum]
MIYFPTRKSTTNSPTRGSARTTRSSRVYEFDDYLRGVNFAQMVGEIAEAQFHHPEIIIRYSGVEIRLTSHEAGGITDDDIEMAELIESEHN